MTAAPPKNGPEPTTDYSLFEGLFARALKLDAATIEELKAIGYDHKNPLPRYHSRVYREALEIARRKTFPDLPREEGMRRLGELLGAGFFNTITGKFIAVAMPMLSAPGLIKKIPRFYTMARSGVTISTVEESPNAIVLVFEDAFGSPDTLLGLMQAAKPHHKKEIAIEIFERGPQGYKVRFRY